MREWQIALEIRRKHLRAMHVEMGQFYDIPNCCIKQFCDEAEIDIPSALVRQQKHNKFIDSALGYVPCDKCMTKIK